MAAFISRRRAVSLAGGALAAGAAGLIGSARSQQVIKEIHQLKPGEFTWHPERSPQGPVAVVASIPEQLVHVYRNGVRIAVSTCSTGAPGHSTPTGVFTVLQKDRNHHSSTYNNAPMPNMNRLTWDGIALHAGKLPGYPASHGCIRLPTDFSAKLFEVTHIGTPVIIAGSHSDPWDLIHPGLVLGQDGEDEFADAVAKLKGRSHPADWSEGQGGPITSVVISEPTARRHCSRTARASRWAAFRSRASQSSANTSSSCAVTEASRTAWPGKASAIIRTLRSPTRRRRR